MDSRVRRHQMACSIVLAAALFFGGATLAAGFVDPTTLAAPDASGRDEQVIILKDLCDTMQYGSLCALGGMVSFPVASALKHFPADFGLQPSEAEQ